MLAVPVDDLSSDAIDADARATVPPPVIVSAPRAVKKATISDLSSDAIDAEARAEVPPVEPQAAAQPKNGYDSSENDVYSGVGEAALHAATAGGASILGGLRGLVHPLTHAIGIDPAATAADAVTSTQRGLTYEPRTDEGKAITELPGQAVEATRKGLNWAGARAAEISPLLGSPNAGDVLTNPGDLIGNIMAAPGKVIDRATGGGTNLAGVGYAIGSAAPTAAAFALGARGGAAGERAAASSAADTAGKPVSAPGAAQTPGTPLTMAEAENVAKSGAAPVKSAPVAADTPTDQIKPGQILSDDARTERAKALAAVGFDEGRESAINGDHRSRAVEYQMTKYDEPAGEAAAKQFEAEKNTMAANLQQQIRDGGGTVGMDQGALDARGKTIVRPIQQLRDWFDTQASALYKAADAQAQGQPVMLKSFGDTLGDDSMITNQDRVYLKSAVQSFAKKAEMTVGDDGTLSGTALQAETVRKWLNSERTNANGKFADALKQSLDNDVTGAAGGPIYDKARAMWRLRQQTIDDPKGISSLLDEEDGNRKVAYEKVPGNLASMPQDQFAHIVDTLRNLPPEIQDSGNAAIGEIKAHYLNQMLDASTETKAGTVRPFWNGNAVKTVIKNNSGRLQTLMSPDELAKVDALRKAGDILSFDPTYPGASAQAANAVKQGLMSHAVKVGIKGGAGAIAGGLFGPAAGVGATMATEGIANRAAGAIGSAQALNRWKSGSVPLDSLLRPSSK